MIFERGPRAFIDETVKLLCGLTVQGSSTQNLSQSASDYIGERVGFLSSLRYSLATLLAQVVVGPEFVVPPYSNVSLLQQPIEEDSDEVEVLNCHRQPSG
ncbi:hypothetical protein GLYMA_09G128251v4 [Glycine max]|nr:hypothetical protein GLYMA_09G128251v4 [Glycine max]KAH1042769.1 hypothetical protein GYH30_024877 [Glycine max]